MKLVSYISFLVISLPFYMYKMNYLTHVYMTFKAIKWVHEITLCLSIFLSISLVLLNHNLI